MLDITPKQKIKAKRLHKRNKNIEQTPNRSKSGRLLFSLLLAPALFRLLFIPFSHPWDIQTHYALFAAIKFDQSPYVLTQVLSMEARTERVLLYHEYFQYPPGLIYLYWPIAKLYSYLNLDPSLNYHFARQSSVPAIPAPWFFAYFFKLPLLVADMGIVILLWKMGGRQVALRYAWNIYPIMVLFWMFEAYGSFCLLLGIYWLNNKKNNQAAIILAIGTAIKYLPAIVLPAILLYMLRERYSLSSIFRFMLLFGLVTAGLCVGPWPLVGSDFLQGNLFSLEWQSWRSGAGLNLHYVFRLLNEWLPEAFSGLYRKSYLFSAALGNLIFPIGMLFTYAYTYRKKLDLNRTVLVTLLGYIAFNKVVNEYYILPMIPFMLLELGHYPTLAKERFYQLLWSLPVAVALITLPIFHVSLSLLAGLGQINLPAVTGILSTYGQTLSYSSLIMTPLCLLYTGLCLLTMHVVATRPCLEVPKVVTQPEPLVIGSKLNISQSLADEN